MGKSLKAKRRKRKTRKRSLPNRPAFGLDRPTWFIKGCVRKRQDVASNQIWDSYGRRMAGSRRSKVQGLSGVGSGKLRQQLPERNDQDSPSPALHAVGHPRQLLYPVWRGQVRR